MILLQKLSLLKDKFSIRTADLNQLVLFEGELLDVLKTNDNLLCLFKFDSVERRLLFFILERLLRQKWLLLNFCRFPKSDLLDFVADLLDQIGSDIEFSAGTFFFIFFFYEKLQLYTIAHICSIWIIIFNK